MHGLTERLDADDHEREFLESRQGVQAVAASAKSIVDGIVQGAETANKRGRTARFTAELPLAAVARTAQPPRRCLPTNVNGRCGSRMEHELPPYFSKNWQFLNPLAGGGQATTWVVRHREEATEGVLKLPKKLDRVAIERFQREIEIVRAVDHPAIVKLLDYSLDQAQLGYVSPRGKVLPRYWEAQTRDANAAARYDLAYQFMRTIAEGLAIVHERGAVHRDLKPSNIIVLNPWVKPQPVVIDFGLAFRPGDERLSIVENRLVANVIAAPAEAYYGHITPTPAWDCIGLGWLYGFLVGAGVQPLNNRFHWKYHPLIAEERAERLKALLALCSDVEVAPQTARGFLALMDNLGLGQRKTMTAPEKADFAAAHQARMAAVAAEHVRRAEIAERVQISLASLAPTLDVIRRRVNDALSERGEMPIELNVFNTNPELAARPMPEHLMAAFRDGTNPAVIFSATCGAYPKRRFNVCVFVHHQDDPKPGQHPFCLRIWCAHENGKFNHQPYLYFENDGAIVDSAEGQKNKLSADDVAKMVINMVTSPEHWRFAS